jgi:ABC-2 type transport system permease protein
LQIAFGLILVLLVLRLTRRSEAVGQWDLLACSPGGRQAPLVAIFLTLAGATGTVSLLFGLGYCLAGFPVGDSLALALSLGLNALTWLSIGLLAAQLTPTALGATSLTGILLLLFLVLRTVGNLSFPLLRWFSPLSWTQEMRPFTALRLRPLLVPAVWIVVLSLLTLSVNRRRDIGTGWLRSRSPQSVRKDPTSLTGVYWIALRPNLIAWLSAAVPLGLICGSWGGRISQQARSNPALGRLVGIDAQTGVTRITEHYTGFVLIFATALAMWFALMSINRLSQAEHIGRVDLVVTSALPRVRWLTSLLVPTICGTLAIMSATAICFGLTLPASVRPSGTSTLGMVSRTLLETAAFWPACLAVIGMGVALTLLFPGKYVITWVYLIYSIAIALFGNVLGITPHAQAVGAFWALPRHISGYIHWMRIANQAAWVAVLVVLSWIGLRRHDFRLRQTI